MVETALVEREIALGQVVTEALDCSGLDVRASLWQYMPDVADWWLVIATPLVDEEGPLAAYAWISKVLRQREFNDQLPLRRVSAVSPKEPLVRALSRAISTAPGPAGIYLRNNMIDGVFIEAALVYRVNAGPKARRATKRPPKRARVVR